MGVEGCSQSIAMRREKECRHPQGSQEVGVGLWRRGCWCRGGGHDGLGWAKGDSYKLRQI